MNNDLQFRGTATTSQPCKRHLYDPNAARTVADLLGKVSSQQTDAVALEAPGRRPLTFGRLERQVGRTVRTLNALGIGPGDRVAIVLQNGPEMAALFLAVAAGATAAPLNPAYQQSELDFYLSDLNAKLLIVQEGLKSEAADVARARGIPILELSVEANLEAGLFTLSAYKNELPEAPQFSGPDDVSLVLHTSGTTSRPKLVSLTNRNICVSAHNINRSLSLTEKDKCLNIMPLFHIHGLIGATLSSLAAGAALVATPGFLVTRIFQWMKTHRPTWITAVPTMYQSILERAEANRNTIEACPLRLIRSSSAALPEPVMMEMERVFGAPVIESYGMTEAAHQMASNPLPPAARVPGSVGPAAGPDVAIMNGAGELLPPNERGEVVIRGENVTVGYDNNAAANRAAFTAGWFRTGDEGFLDDDGYLFLTGRLKEIINRGGEKVAPREIDDVLLAHDAVRQAVAFAIPDPKLGEEIGAAVVRREGASVSERDLLAFAAERLADFKLPRRIVFIEQIPKGPTGKLQRIGLAKRLGINSVAERAPVAFEEPRTNMERRLAETVSEVLDVQRVGRNDDFFALGGDSMLATQLILRLEESLGVVLPGYVLFDSPKIASLAEFLQQTTQRSVDPIRAPIERCERGEEFVVPLSPFQEMLWVQEKLLGPTPSNNRPGALRLRGPLDVPTLQLALRDIVGRHGCLRATFSQGEKGPECRVGAVSSVELEHIDLSDLDADAQEKRLSNLSRAHAQQLFDLETGPIIRTLLVKLGEHEHMLLINVHHIVFDAWSMRVFRSELAALYGARVVGERPPLPVLPIQFADYTQWQRDWTHTGDCAHQLEYWKAELQDSWPALELPTDRPLPARPTTAAASRVVTFSNPEAEKLRLLGRSEGLTLFMTALTAFDMALARWCKQDEITIGVPVAGRDRPEAQPLIGLFLNYLIVRVRIPSAQSFRETMRLVRSNALRAYANQGIPYPLLVRALRPPTTIGRKPFFRVLFELKPFAPGANTAAGLEISDERFETGISPFDLLVELTEHSDGLEARFGYKIDLFEAETIDDLAGQWREILEGAIGDPESA